MSAAETLVADAKQLEAYMGRRLIIEIIGGMVLLTLIIIVAFIIYDKFAAPKPVGSESVPAKESPAVKNTPTEEVVIKKPIRVFKPVAKKNTKLPAAIQADPNKAVLTSTQAPSNLRPQTVTTTIDTSTGKAETFIKTDPYPWLAYEPRGEAKLAYGYKYDHSIHAPKQIGRFQVGFDVVRVKALTVGITGTIDSDRDAFVGVGLTYRW